VPYTDKKSLSSEHTFQTDTLDIEALRRCLRDQTMKLAYELRQSGKLTAGVAVKIRYTDFNTYTRQRRVKYTAHDQQLLPVVDQLFTELFTRRQCIRLVGVRFDRLVPGHTQLDLFADTQEDSSLLRAMDKIRTRFGRGSLGKG
jgi:DNA polymerase-4